MMKQAARNQHKAESKSTAYMSNETLHDLTLVVHVPQHGGHIIVVWSHQWRAEHYSQVVCIHLATTRHTKVKECMSHIVLPATQYRWQCPTLIPERKAGSWFTYRARMEGWVDVYGWLCRKTVYLVTRPSTIDQVPSRHHLSTSMLCTLHCNILLPLSMAVWKHLISVFSNMPTTWTDTEPMEHFICSLSLSHDFNVCRETRLNQL